MTTTTTTIQKQNPQVIGEVPNSPEDLEVCPQIMRSQPFISWWWLAPIITAIPTIIINLLLEKRTPTPIRPPDLHIVDELHSSTHANGRPEIIFRHMVNNPPLFINPPIVPPTEIDVISKIEHKQQEHYERLTYDVPQHPYLTQLMNDYTSLRQAGYFTHEEIDSEPNQDLNAYVQHLMNTEITPIEATVHLPTISIACKEMYSYLEDVRKHFRVHTNRRLSRTEINYYFGKYVLPKVISHLSSDDKFQVDGTNIAMTAQEVIFMFLKTSGRQLPFNSLLCDEDTAIKDIERVVQYGIHNTYWIDNLGMQWELSGPLVSKVVCPIARCLFHYPTQNLCTDIGAL